MKEGEGIMLTFAKRQGRKGITRFSDSRGAAANANGMIKMRERLQARGGGIKRV